MASEPIRVSKLDPNFKSEVMSHEDARDITACFACGTCTAGCPIHCVYREHDPRKIARMVNFGMKDRVLGSPYIWYCSECYLCEKRCPQGVKFSSILDVLKGMALEEGYSPPVSIDTDFCSGCGICIGLCPYEAIEFKEENGKKVARLVITSCRGCGVCAGACPSGAIKVSLFEDKCFLDQIESSVA